MPQRLSDETLSELVPDIKNWNNGHGIDLESWAGYMGTMELAIAFGELFWPDFFEYRSCIFRGSGLTKTDNQRFERTLQSLNGNLASMEGLRNHIHVWDIFPRAAEDPQPTREQCLYLARLLREMWETKLNREFSQRKFHVVVNEDDEEGDFQVTFFEIRDDGSAK